MFVVNDDLIVFLEYSVNLKYAYFASQNGFSGVLGAYIVSNQLLPKQQGLKFLLKN